jgi:hypothetical protein
MMSEAEDTKVPIDGVPPKLAASIRFHSSPAATFVALFFLVFAFAAVPVRSQELPLQPGAVAEAARNSREHAASSANHPKIITNADLGVQHSVPARSSFHFPSSSSNADEGPTSDAATCDNPEAQRLGRELQATEQDLDQLRSQLSYQPPVISDNDLDLESFQPGNSGLDVGAPPLLDSVPPAPERVAAVELEERIAYLQKALRVACAPPEAATIQVQIDDLEQQSSLLQREFALDQDAYYSNTDFARDTAGQAQLDAEQEQIESLQAEIEQLRQELADLNVPQT